VDTARKIILQKIIIKGFYCVRYNGMTLANGKY